MLTRSYCFYCKGQIDDKEEIMQNCVTRRIAHRRCLENQAEERISDTPLKEGEKCE